jgi:hypothetical protein
MYWVNSPYLRPIRSVGPRGGSVKKLLFYRALSPFPLTYKRLPLIRLLHLAPSGKMEVSALPQIRVYARAERLAIHGN